MLKTELKSMVILTMACLAAPISYVISAKQRCSATST